MKEFKQSQPSATLKNFVEEFEAWASFYNSVATSLIRWRNLPGDMLRSEYIEWHLMSGGAAVALERSDSDMLNSITMGIEMPKMNAERLLILPFAQSYGLDIYGQPFQWRAIGIGNQTLFARNIENSVLIRNNYWRIPTLPYLWLTLWDMIDCRQAMRVNRNSIKTPIIFKGDKSLQASIKAYYKKLSENDPYIMTSNSVDMLPEILQNPNKYYGSELWEAYLNYKRELLMLLGISVPTFEKAERLTFAESNSMYSEIRGNLNMLYESRTEAAKKINKMFGLNIDVEINDAFIQKLLDNDMTFLTDMGGGKKPEEVDDGNLRA